MGRVDWYGHVWGTPRSLGSFFPKDVSHKGHFVEDEQKYLAKMAQRSPDNRPLLSAAEEGKKKPPEDT